MECVHRSCRCQVQDGEDFCSDHCREAAAKTGHEDHRCECGHPACAEPTA